MPWDTYSRVSSGVATTPTTVDSALMVTDRATSPPDRNTITVDPVPLATLPTSTMPVASSGDMPRARAIPQAASGMIR
jgi:hypothetical protein